MDKLLQPVNKSNIQEQIDKYQGLIPNSTLVKKYRIAMTPLVLNFLPRRDQSIANPPIKEAK